MTQTLSNEGLEAIARFEGLRLSAYRDAGGVPTIGYGHTGGVRMGQIITRARALALLRQDAQTAVEGVRQAVHRDISQGQFDALVSFAFNVGVGAMRGSTLIRKLNAGDRTGAAAEFLKWVKAGGRVLPGLVARRKIEQSMFLHGSASGVHKWLTENEARWVREYDKLLSVTGTAASDRRRVLRRVMTEQRKRIWRAAQNGGGWDIADRRARYRSLLARTS
jgi:lysozyme